MEKEKKNEEEEEEGGNNPEGTEVMIRNGHRGKLASLNVLFYVFNLGTT